MGPKRLFWTKLYYRCSRLRIIALKYVEKNALVILKIVLTDMFSSVYVIFQLIVGG